MLRFRYVCPKESIFHRINEIESHKGSLKKDDRGDEKRGRNEAPGKADGRGEMAGKLRNDDIFFRFCTGKKSNLNFNN